MPSPRPSPTWAMSARMRSPAERRLPWALTPDKHVALSLLSAKRASCRSGLPWLLASRRRPRLRPLRVASSPRPPRSSAISRSVCAMLVTTSSRLASSDGDVHGACNPRRAARVVPGWVWGLVPLFPLRVAPRLAPWSFLALTSCMIPTLFSGIVQVSVGAAAIALARRPQSLARAA